MDGISKRQRLDLRPKQKDLVPKPPQYTENGRKTKTGRKAAGCDKAGGVNKGPQAESWRVDVGTGGRTPAAEQGATRLAQRLAGPGRMEIGGARVMFPPISQTSYRVLPPIRASASVPLCPEETKTGSCRSTPDGEERTNSSLPPPSSPPTSPPSPAPTPCGPQAPPSSPPTLDDQEITPQALFEAMLSHPQWTLIKKVLLRKNKNIAELEKHSEDMMEWVLHVVNEGVLPAMALYQVHHLSQDPLSAATSHSNCVSISSRSSVAGLVSPVQSVGLSEKMCFSPVASPDLRREASCCRQSQVQASSQGSDQTDVSQRVVGSSSQGALLGNMVQGREEKEACACQESLCLNTQQEHNSSGRKEKQEVEKLQKEETTSFFSKSATRSPSPRSDVNSIARCHDLHLTAQRMLDTVVRMAHSASRSVFDEEDCQSDEGSSVSSFDQAEYDLDRLLVSQSTGARMLQARIDCSSDELIISIYHLLLDTQTGRFPSACRVRSQPNVQNLEAKQCLDWELFSPLMYTFLHLAFKQLMENYLGPIIFLPDEHVPMSDHLKWLWKEDRADSNSNVSLEDSDSSDSSLDWSIKFTPGPSQGIVGRKSWQSRQRPSSSASQDQRVALKAISEVLTVKVGGVLHCTCNDPELTAVMVNKGLDAKFMARLASLLSSSSSEATDLEGTTGSVNPELRSSLINQEEGRSERADLPPSETSFLKLGEVTLHHQTLRDLLHMLMVRLAFQESPCTSRAATPSQLEDTLLQEVGWILWTQGGISLVLEDQPQSPFFSGADALEAMLEAAYSELLLSSPSSRSQVRSARHGEAGAICCLAETVATVICRHAEDRRAPASPDVGVLFITGCDERDNAKDSAGLEKAGGRSSSLRRKERIDDGSEESSGLKKAGETQVEIDTERKVEERCGSFGLVTTRKRPLSCPAADSGLLKAWEMMDGSSEEDSEDDSSSSICTSWFCHSSSSSTSDLSSCSSSQTFSNSSISSSSMSLDSCLDGDNLGPTEPSSLQRWFTLMRYKAHAVTKSAQSTFAKGRRKRNSVAPLNCEIPCPGPDPAEFCSVPGEQKQKKKRSVKGFFRRVSAALSKAFCCSCVTHQ